MGKYCFDPSWGHTSKNCIYNSSYNYETYCKWYMYIVVIYYKKNNKLILSFFRNTIITQHADTVIRYW